MFPVNILIPKFKMFRFFCNSTDLWHILVLHNLNFKKIILLCGVVAKFFSCHIPGYFE